MVDYWFCDWWFRILPHLIVSNKFPLWSSTEMKSVMISQPKCVLTFTQFVLLFMNCFFPKRGHAITVLAHCEFWFIIWSFITMRHEHSWNVAWNILWEIKFKALLWPVTLSQKQFSIFPCQLVTGWAGSSSSAGHLSMPLSCIQKKPLHARYTLSAVPGAGVQRLCSLGEGAVNKTL